MFLTILLLGSKMLIERWVIPNHISIFISVRVGIVLFLPLYSILSVKSLHFRAS